MGVEQAGPLDQRRRIMHAAFEVFVERGYGGASTLAIASRARVSKRELYALFGSKQAILTACITWRAERMRLPLDVPVPRSEAALGATLRSFGAVMLREFCQPSTIAMYRLAVAEAERAPEVARMLDSIGYDAVDCAAAALLAGAVQAGLLAGEPASMTTTFFAILMGDALALRLLMRLAEPPDEAAIATRAQAATEVLLALYKPRPEATATLGPAAGQ
jgi:AcrR family transcriptional regulator